MPLRRTSELVAVDMGADAAGLRRRSGSRWKANIRSRRYFGVPYVVAGRIVGEDCW